MECKFRSQLPDGTLDLSVQIDRYRRMTGTETTHRLIIALGVGGHPDNPDTLYLIPDECIPDDGIIDIDDCDDFVCDNTPESFRSHLLRFYL